MRSLLLCVVASALCLCAGISTAAPYFSVTLSSSVRFPTDMLAGSTSVGDYVVTNVSGRSQAVYVHNLPAGFSVVPANGATPASCGSSVLVNGASCTLRLSYESNVATTVSQFLPTVCPTSQYVTGCIVPNTATTFSVINPSSSGSLNITGVTFTEPGTETMTLTNQSSSLAITNLNRIVALPSGVTDAGGTCSDSSFTLAPGASCTYVYTATVNAYGSAAVIFTYDEGGVTQTDTSASIAVTNTTVSINGGQDIEGKTDMLSGTFAIQNTGNFSWQTPAVARSSGDDWLTINSIICDDGDTRPVPPTKSCTVSYTIVPPHDLSSVVTASGDNIQPTTANFNPDENISIGVEGDAQYQHLAYRAVKVTNLTTVTETLSDIRARPPNPVDADVELCNATGSNCGGSSYASDCQNNLNLLAGATCHIWYEAQETGTLNPSTTADVNVSVTATPSGGPANLLSRDISFTYDYALYAGGVFTTAGGNAANRIAKWDGSNWSALANGASGDVRALTVWNGDLYVGGAFMLPASGIAKWNGDSWSALGGGTDNTVSALSVGPSGNLYAGGQFSTPGNRIAQWDGSSWSDSSSGSSFSEVQVLAFPSSSSHGFLNPKIYAGGTAIGSDYVMQTSSNDWSSLGSGVGGSGSIPLHVAAVSIGGPTAIYVGGYFPDAGGTPVNNIARWDETSSTWSALGGGLDNGSIFDSSGDASVFALALNNSILYAGGSFDNARNTIGGQAISVEYIAEWDGSSWLDMAGGMNGYVYALTFNVNLYAGGAFTSPAAYVAQWNGTSWSALGSSGVNANVYALTTAPSLTLSNG